MRNENLKTDHLAGLHLEPSDWVTVDQDMIDVFGDLTRDPDPYHQDPGWAADNSPFGGTIAYGFLTISLLSHLQKSAFMKSASKLGDAFEHSGMPVNYGFDRLRLVAPVPAGSRVRGKFSIERCIAGKNGATVMHVDCAVEIAGNAKPALVGKWLFLLTG